MPRQSITISEPNAHWLKAQIESKEYSSNSEIVNDLIRQARKNEKAELEAVRALLMEAEENVKTQGFSNKTPAEIKQEVIARKRQNGTL